MYKNSECRTFNLKYVIMSGVAVHKMCITLNYSCKLRWRLGVQHQKLLQRTSETIAANIRY